MATAVASGTNSYTRFVAAAGGAPDHPAGDGQPEGVPPPLRQEAAQARQDELRSIWSLEPLH